MRRETPASIRSPGDVVRFQWRKVDMWLEATVMRVDGERVYYRRPHQHAAVLEETWLPIDGWRGRARADGWLLEEPADAPKTFNAHGWKRVA